MDVIELTRKLVQIDSTNPGSYEAQMLSFLEDFFLKLECGDLILKTEEVLPGRSNLMAELPGESIQAEEKTSACKSVQTKGNVFASEPVQTEKAMFSDDLVPVGGHVLPDLVFICHMDTVTIGNGWTKEPFGAEIQDGRLYGRGSCDMKSGMACALSAFLYAAANWDRLKHTVKRTLKFIATVDEEGQMQGVERAIASGWISKNSLVLDMEPTNGQIQMAHKGRTWFEVEMQGITAHASNPWKGADAVAAMAIVITSLRQVFKDLPVHEELGGSTITFGMIQGGYQPYVVPDYCRLSIDMRLAPPFTTDGAKDEVEKAIRMAEKEVPGVQGSYRITGDRPFIERNPDSVLMAALRESCLETTGVEAEIGTFNGYTDTAVIAGMLHNRECMSYGPGNLEQAHKPDEYVEIRDIIRYESVLKNLVNRMWNQIPLSAEV